MKINKRLSLVVLMIITTRLFSQNMTLDEAVQTVLQRNNLIKSAQSQIDYFKQMKIASTDIGKVTAMWMHGQYNSVYRDNNLTVIQNVPFPTTLHNQSLLGKEEVAGAVQNLKAVQNQLVYEVKILYQQLQYQEALRDLLLTQDSLYNDFARASSLRYKSGESNLLEKTTAESQSLEIHNTLRQNESDIQISRARLQALLKSAEPVSALEKFQKRNLPGEIDSILLISNPELKFLEQQIVISNQIKKVERSRLMPDLMIGFFVQSLTGVQNINGQDQFFPRKKTFEGVELGLAIPLWIAPNIARAKAASFREEAQKNTAENFKVMLAGNYTQAFQEIQKNTSSLNYYETNALRNADLILVQAGKAYKGGEIGYIEYLQSLRNALNIKTNYVQIIHQYNLSIIKLEFLLGKY